MKPINTIMLVIELNRTDREKYIKQNNKMTTKNAKAYITILVLKGIKTILSRESDMVKETIIGVIKMTIGAMINKSRAKIQYKLLRS
jgi:predicted nucleic-acid-binding protein